MFVFQICMTDGKSWSDSNFRTKRSEEGSQESGGSSIRRQRASSSVSGRTQYESNVFNVILNEIPPVPPTDAERQYNTKGDSHSIQTNFLPNVPQNDHSSANQVPTLIPPASAQNSPATSLRPSRTRVDGALVRNIILQAVRNVQTEDQTLEQRLRLGKTNKICFGICPVKSIKVNEICPTRAIKLQQTLSCQINKLVV